MGIAVARVGGEAVRHPFTSLIYCHNPMDILKSQHHTLAHVVFDHEKGFAIFQFPMNDRSHLNFNSTKLQIETNL
jgi:hypothetical protein